MKNVLLIGLGILLFYSCSKDILIDMPQHQSKLVVNSIFTETDTLKVYVNHSVGMFDNTPDTITDAIVKMYENNILFETLVCDSGLYKSFKPRVTNKQYKIEVSYSGYDIATATTYIPTKTEMRDIFYKQNVMKDEDGGHSISQVILSFDDNALEENQYELLIRYKDIKFSSIEEQNDSIQNLGTVGFTHNTDPVLANEGLLENEPITLVFKDQLFNGKKYTMHVNFHEPWDLEDNNNNPLYITLRSITKEYYLYQKQLLKHLKGQQGELFVGAGDPVPMYTNIVNGYGLFSGYSEVTDTIYKQNNK